MWDGCRQGNKNYLDRLLKRAAGIIILRVARLPILTYSKHRAGHPCNMAENTRSAYSSISASMAWLQHIYLTIHSLEHIHNYKSRNKDLVRLPLGKTTKFQTTFKYNAAKSWNTLPHTCNLRHDQSFTSVKLKVKKHLYHLSQLSPLETHCMISFVLFCFISIIYFLFILFWTDLHLNQQG